MSCCGSQRAAARTSSAAADGTARHWTPGTVEFEFAGQGQMVVTGPLTGTVYRFTPGARIQVHGSDAPSLVSVPGLRLAR